MSDRSLTEWNRTLKKSYSGFFIYSKEITFLNFKLFLHRHQVVQEYERAVIFRLGRLMTGGAKGPGKVSIKLHIRLLNNLLFLYPHII